MGLCILIVDDDHLLIEKLVNKVNWDKLGISTVLKANDIRHSMEILEKVTVDILLSDVEMPGGSGLELLEWVRDRQISLECIFLSSYALFAYAQKAISLNTYEYMLKPISNREMEQKLLEVTEKIRAKKENKYPEENKQGKDREFWHTILLGGARDRFPEDATTEYPEPGKKFLVVLQKRYLNEKQREDIPIYNLMQQRAIEKFFLVPGKKLKICFQELVQINDYLCVLVFDEPRDSNVFHETLIAYRNYLQESLSAEIVFCVGEVCETSRVREKRYVLEQIVKEYIPGEEAILYEGEWMKTEVEYITPPWKAWEIAMSSGGQLADTEAEITAFLRSKWRDGMLKVSILKHFRKELIQTVHKCLIGRDIENVNVFDGREFDELYHESIYTLPGMERFIRYIFERLSGFNSRENNSENIAEQMKTYINNHVGEKVSRTVLANAFYLSEDYLSRIFVAETGMSIPGYVTLCRMQKAQELLKHSSLSVSMIAQEVGYTNFSYFSKNFRDYAGYTPNEYRNRIKRQNNI